MARLPLSPYYISLETPSALWVLALVTGAQPLPHPPLSGCSSTLSAHSLQQPALEGTGLSRNVFQLSHMYTQDPGESLKNVVPRMNKDLYVLSKCSTVDPHI